ncbi:MAG TPA: sensor domain-containing diguanylate cyclase [Candidatus Dormibacteraeota bacterium]
MASETVAAGASNAQSPWRSSGLFWGILALAFLSVILPPGPTRMPWFLAALSLAIVVALGRLMVPWSRISPRFKVIPLLLDTALIGCLIFSAGKATGLGSLLLLPLLYSAFYGSPKESLLVIPAITLAQIILGVASNDSLLVLVRVLIVWVSLTTMISLAAHALRARLQANADTAREQARQSAVVAAATQALTATLDPDAVVRTAAKLAAELVSPTATAARRGQYFSVEGNVLTLCGESDETGMTAVDMVMTLHDHASAGAVVRTGQPINGPVDLGACSPQIRANLTRFGITHGAYVPVRLGGEIKGILNAAGRGAPIEPALFDRLQLLGSLTELALANAAARQLLESQALTDPLTNIANRRELERAFGRLPDRMPFAFVAIDVDDLKPINDRWGHSAGDAAILGVASAIASVARRGDTVARVGGDEFAVLMLDASVDAVDHLAERIHVAVRSLLLPSGPLRVSIGGCVAPPGGDTGLVQGMADAALYQSKQRGGSCTVIKEFEAGDAVLIA